MHLRSLLCFGAFTCTAACAPSIPKIGDAAGPSADDTALPEVEDDPLPTDDVPEDEDEDEDETDPGPGGEYFGEMLVMIAWPSWGDEEEWDELCENGAEWSVDDAGVLSGEMQCDVFFNGRRPQSLDVQIAGQVNEDGAITGALTFNLEGWLTGDTTLNGSILEDEMLFVGETEVELGRSESPVTFEFDGGRR